MEEMDSMQWQKIATEDLRQGGSLRVELKSPVFLTGKVTIPLHIGNWEILLLFNI